MGGEYDEESKDRSSPMTGNNSGGGGDHHVVVTQSSDVTDSSIDLSG